MLYLLFKFLHVLSAMVWIGSVVTLASLGAMVMRTSDRPLLLGLTRYSGLVGARVTGPGAGLTILTGFGAMGVGRTGFPLWILWGIAVAVLSMVVGATVFRKAGMAFGRLLARPDASAQEIAAGQRRMVIQQVAMTLLLLTAVWAMVFKPA